MKWISFLWFENFSSANNQLKQNAKLSNAQVNSMVTSSSLTRPSKVPNTKKRRTHVELTSENLVYIFYTWIGMVFLGGKFDVWILCSAERRKDTNKHPHSRGHTHTHPSPCRLYVHEHTFVFIYIHYVWKIINKYDFMYKFLCTHTNNENFPNTISISLAFSHLFCVARFAWRIYV